MPSSLLSDMDGSSNGHLDADQRAMQIALELSMLGLTNDDVDEPNSNSFDEYRNKKSINMTEGVSVPTSEHVAEIVGRQGCKIKALRAKTNTYIKTPVRGEEPVFLITGRKEDVALAKREILSAAEHFSQIRAQRKNSALSTGPPTNVPGHTTIKVRVPYRVVGLVVGPKGATIKRIQQMTNTYIVTPSRDKEPVFEVTGLPESVESARTEIQNHITVRTGGLSDGNDGDGVFNGDSLTDFRSSSIYNSSFPSFHDSSLNQLPQRSQSTDSFYFTSNGSAKISTGNDYNPINSPFSPKGFFFSEIPSPDRDYDSHSGSSGSSFEPTPPSPSIWAPEVGSRENVSRIVGDHGGTFTCSSSIPTSVITSLSNGNGRPESPHTSLRRLRSEPMNGFSAFTPFSSSVTTISTQLSPTDTNSITSSLTNTICRPSSTEGTLNINNNNINTIGGKKRDCLICCESEVVAALVPCGHNLFCMECANRIIEENSNCPVCQKQVSQVLRIFS